MGGGVEIKTPFPSIEEVGRRLGVSTTRVKQLSELAGVGVVKKAAAKKKKVLHAMRKRRARGKSHRAGVRRRVRA